MYQSIVEAIRAHAQTQPEKLAVAAMDGEITYSELNNNIYKMAQFYRSSGCAKGAKIILSAVPLKAYFYCYYGAHLAGCVVIPIDSNMKEEKIRNIVKETGCRAAILNQLFEMPETAIYSIEQISDFLCDEVPTIKETFDVVQGMDLADIIFTTGTTGKSKGVMLSHGNLTVGAHNVINGTDMTKEEVVMAPLPLNHSNALGTMSAYMYNGATLVVYDGFLNVKGLVERIKKYHCTAFSGAPSALRILEKVCHGRIEEILGGMHYVEIGTAPMDLEQRQYLMRRLPNVKLLINYGASEARRAVYMDLNIHADKPKAIGHAVKGMEIRIVDDDYHVIQSSFEKIGRISIHGGTCMLGYWNDSELTKETLVNGGVVTNDLGYLDEEGFLFLVGRANDVINVGGKKVSPFEIEDAILSFGNIAECACVAMKDPKGILENVPAAFIVPYQEIAVEDLKNFLRSKLESYKVPVRYKVLDELPKNYVGKIERKKLQEIAALF